MPLPVTLRPVLPPSSTVPFHVLLEMYFGQVLIIGANNKDAEHTPLPLRKVLRVNLLFGFLFHFIWAVPADAGVPCDMETSHPISGEYASPSKWKVGEVGKVTSCTSARRGSMCIFWTVQALNTKDYDLWGGVDNRDTKLNSQRALSVLWAKAAPNQSQCPPNLEYFPLFL